MMDAASRLGRLTARARHHGWSEQDLAALASALGGAQPTEALLSVLDVMAPRSAGAVIALAFGGASPDPDALEEIALSLASRRAAVLDAVLDQLDPSAPCWPGAVAWLEGRGVAFATLASAVLRRSAVWVALDGSLAPVGAALRDLVAVAPSARVPRLLSEAGDGASLAVARCVRALGAAVPRDDGLLEACFRALPSGLRGAAAEPLLALDGARFVEVVREVARGAGGFASADAAMALEALLRHRPEATADLVDAVLAPSSSAPRSLRAEALRAHGPGDPARFAEAAAAHARLDPGEWVAEVAVAWPESAARPLWESLLGIASPLATQAAEALLSAAHSGRGELAAALLREPGSVSREAVVRRCRSLPEGEIAPLLVLLDDRSSELRLYAVRCLEGRGEGVASALVERFKHERAPRVRAAIVAALGYSPSEGAEPAADPARAAVIARADAARSGAGRRPSRWLERCSATLRWADGGDVPPSVAAHLVRLQSLRGVAEPDAEVVEIARMLRSAEREAWAEDLLTAWIEADAPAQDHGVLLLATLLGGEFVSRALGSSIPLWHKGSRRSLATSAVQLLAMRAEDHSLCALDLLAWTHPHESFGAAAQHALDEEARSRGVELEEMLDLAAPRYGLVDGARRFELGHHVVSVEVRGAEVVLRDEQGSVLHAPPRPSRRDDPDRVAEMRRTLRLLHLTLPASRERQRERMEDAMASRRSFPFAHLRACLSHPLVGPLCRDLWWVWDGRLWRASALADAEREGSASIAHALDGASRDELEAAPFRQLSRAVCPRPAGAERERAWPGFVGRVLVAAGERHARALPPWSAHGWTPGVVEQGQCRAFSLRFRGARVEAVLEVDGIALWSEQERRTAVGALRFEAMDGARPLTLGELPETVFSEAVVRAEAMLGQSG